MLPVFIFALLASILSLGAALVAQYGFDFPPCELCQLQRVPYVAIILLSVVGLALPRYGKFIAAVIVLLFIAGGGIATYHTAVEHHWVKGPSACTSSPSDPEESMDDLLKKIQSAPTVACDQPPFEFHGITMAQTNAHWSFMLALVTIFMIWKTKDE